MVKSPLLYYSHSDYSDVWPILFGQTDKYFDSTHNKYLFTNSGKGPDGWSTLHYDDTLSYQNRFVSCLKQLSCETVILHHEDMFLYSEPNYEKLSEAESLLDTYDFVKLIKTGRNIGFKVKEDLYELYNVTSDYFAIQPTIWRLSSLIDLYENVEASSIWDFEVKAGEYCVQHNIKGSYYYNSNVDKPRGGHFDSNVYPYIATAVVKGKWNFREYSTELGSLFEEYEFEEVRGRV